MSVPYQFSVIEKALIAAAVALTLVVWPGDLMATTAPVRTVAMTNRVAETPFPGSPQAIGSAANGCLSGAMSLPLSGPGWEALRPGRNRNWGHPALIAFIRDLAGRTSGLGQMQIGDIAQPRGGHMTSGHGSHQTGLDVDIFYRLADQPLSDQERAEPQMESVVAEDGSLIPELWGDAQLALLKTFASDPRVERIFVNPVIKRALCDIAGGDRAWLRVIRPWWGHDDHFHVRIQCPDGNGDCIPGPPLPPGDGCGAELQSWITSGDWKGLPRLPLPTQHAHRPEMPAACRAIISAF
ncbi:penicillin-insensitive murein endopeptidase [Telmatospirillum sp.]|uniref:penicillin-insensitive murein endopeptidase n=1 Tax=Telmatospirillum sp. TaxID=2079197 RepID=UPI0028486555|nr:penicillin-insensitive murein endopeptidase [Telmatospirillum sp.]MDR3439022.1 penicillin-insensitive murein endopeptidase [Telmatospirillum sp.]